MKFKRINKVCEGKYITRYNIDYETEIGSQKTYEMISRSNDLDTFEKLHETRPDAVIMIIHNETGDKLLLNREFRMAVGEWVYNFPAGLIDEGENERDAAKRELYEETGLTLESVSEVWKESYSAIGFSNEKGVVIVGTASGSIRPSDSDMEEIAAAWYTKQDVRKLLENSRFAARTQAYCALWSKNKEEECELDH